jgi:hypothetical protein
LALPEPPGITLNDRPKCGERQGTAGSGVPDDLHHRYRGDASLVARVAALLACVWLGREIPYAKALSEQRRSGIDADF